MRKSILISLFSLFIVYSNDCHSQITFGTSHAVVDISINYDDSVSRLKSRDVKVTINYETAEFLMYLNATDLIPYPDSMAVDIDAIGEKEISYRGLFDLNYIKTKNHPPLSFEVNGDLLVGEDNSFKLQGRGDLVHVSDGAYPCQLSLNFRIPADELSSELNTEFKFDYILINVQQVILQEDFE